MILIDKTEKNKTPRPELFARIGNFYQKNNSKKNRQLNNLYNFIYNLL